MDLEEALERYVDKHQVDGIAYVKNINGSYATDDDNALYTGLFLGAAAYRYAADPRSENLEPVRLGLRGVSLLTRATGEPGVLARRAMPLENAWDEFGYDFDLSRTTEGNSWGPKIQSGEVIEHDGYAVQLKTTRDQITGILFGLACVRVFCFDDPQIRDSVTQIVGDLYGAIKERGWSLRDHQWETHGTSAHQLDAPLKLLMSSLAYSCGAGEEKPSNSFFQWIPLVTIHYNTFFQNAYSHGLNAIAAHALWLLGDYHDERRGVRQWMNRIEEVVRHEWNPFWEMLLDFQMTEDGAQRQFGAGTTPYTRFFKWNRYRKELSVRQGTIGPMIDFMIVGYMHKYWTERVGA